MATRTRAPSPPSLPAGWEALWSEDAREYYYYRAETGEVKWTKPSENEQSGAEGAPRPPAPPLPAGWEAVWSGDEGEYYYFQEETGEVSWDLPDCCTSNEAGARNTLQMMSSAEAVEAIPDELWARLVPAEKAMTLRLTSKTVLKAIDKLILPASIRLKHVFPNGDGLEERMLPVRARYRIVALNVADCQLGAQGAGKLAAILTQTITRLSLTRNSIGPQGANKLGRVLPQLARLSRLDLDDNNLGNCCGVPARFHLSAPSSVTPGFFDSAGHSACTFNPLKCSLSVDSVASSSRTTPVCNHTCTCNHKDDHD